MRISRKLQRFGKNRIQEREKRDGKSLKKCYLKESEKKRKMLEREDEEGHADWYAQLR